MNLLFPQRLVTQVNLLNFLDLPEHHYFLKFDFELLFTISRSVSSAFISYYGYLWVN